MHGYTEVNQVLTEYMVFSSDERRYSGQPVPHRDNPVLGSLSAIDPPRHHVLRRLVGRAFTPRAIHALFSSITDTVRTQLAGVYGELDVIGRLGHPLPVRTIATLLGVEADRQPDFVRWSEAITSLAGSFAEDPVRQAAFRTARAELAAYLREVFAAHPDALARLRAEPELVPHAIEEVLRFLPPVGGTDRFTTGPARIAGHTVETGRRVIAMMLSANRLNPAQSLVGRERSPYSHRHDY
ncbi:hypothetical protein ACU635_30460 [[Actinomadura] parvosata]|uniref:hypothetical protein n=1 Tax=[Actinomadura] parvosata TaxID=1955412 RepID=UPI00406BFB47